MAETDTERDLIWAILIHLSYNMWDDRDPVENPNRPPFLAARPYLRFEDNLWNDLLQQMAAAGLNMVVIDVGDAVQYASHPEIAVENAWSRDKLKQELDKTRALGLEPIPKLNFSTCHDHWLGPYERCVSTDEYYEVCRNLIAEVIDLFDHPRFFHLGMDEETAQHQRTYAYVVIRQYDLWWHDFELLVDAVDRHGVRPWIWSDFLWHHPERFFERMPITILQSNWYYGKDFDPQDPGVRAYRQLEEEGYDQLPTGSNWSTPDNFGKTVDHCTTLIPAPHLLGFLQTTWKPLTETFRDDHIAAIDQVATAIGKCQT